MDINTIINHFKALGFTEYEGKVYLSLLQHHPASAYKIAKASNVPHSRVYDIARRLVKKGYVISQGSNPEQYSPISPDELIDSLTRDNTRRVEALQAQLASVCFESDFDPVWNLSGEKKALALARGLIESAKEEIFIGLWDAQLQGLQTLLKERHDSGVRVYILIYGHMDLDFGNVFHHSIDNVQANDPTLDLVVDSRVCITGSLGGDNTCQAVWTRNKGLVSSIEGYLIHDFFIAEINEKFGTQMDKVFGRNLEKLRKKYDH